MFTFFLSCKYIIFFGVAPELDTVKIWTFFSYCNSLKWSCDLVAFNEYNSSNYSYIQYNILTTMNNKVAVLKVISFFSIIHIFL